MHRTPLPVLRAPPVMPSTHGERKGLTRMDDQRFDRLARTVAATGTRRGALRLLVGGAFGLLAARREPEPVAAQQAQIACGAVGAKCRTNGQCCHGAVCRNGACACRGGLSA